MCHGSKKVTTVKVSVLIVDQNNLLDADKKLWMFVSDTVFFFAAFAP